MRSAWVSVVLVLGGCIHRAPSVPPLIASSTCRLTSVTEVPAQLISAQTRDPHPMLQQMLRRESAAAALVDTIVVLSPDSFVVRLGQTIPDSQDVKSEGRSHSGARRRALPTWLAVEDTSVAQFRQGGLTGLKVGRTQIVVSIYSTDSAAPVHAPPSCVPVRVVP